jgi:hypothetical protein
MENPDGTNSTGTKINTWFFVTVTLLPILQGEGSCCIEPGAFLWCGEAGEVKWRKIKEVTGAFRTTSKESPEFR